jgi:hypothetical protein
MADPEHPLSLSTVIWFRSLEFMFLGYGYDMVLLPPRHPTDHDYKLSQRGGACAGITVPAGLVQPGDGMPSVAIIIFPWRVIGCSILVPLG